MDDPPEKLSVAFLIEVVIAGLIVFAIAITIGLLTGASTGTMADWVAGISTFAAFVAAVIAGWFAYHALLVERRRDKHRDELERSAQASRVGAWGDMAVTASHSVKFTPGKPDEIAIGPTLPDHLDVTVRNASELPVHNFWLQIYLPSKDNTDSWDLVADHYIGRVLPYEPGVNDAPIDLLAKISTPGGGVFPNPDAPMFQRLAAEFAARDTPAGQSPRIAFGWWFRDNGNREWLRVPNQDLREGSRPVPPEG